LYYYGFVSLFETIISLVSAGFYIRFQPNVFIRSTTSGVDVGRWSTASNGIGVSQK